MELIKKNIHMSKIKGNMFTQITLEDDFNVPDVKSDIDEIITDSGRILIESIRVSNGKVILKGKLAFSLLYGSFNDSRLIHNMSGEIVLDETINMEGIKDSDSVHVKCDIEDLSIGIINSRKISVKAIVGLKITAEDICDIQPVVDIVCDRKIDCLKKELDVSEIVIFKKDIFRIKDEIDIPSNKLNMAQILWDSLDVRSINTRLLNGKVDISGELQMFVLYEAEEENAPVQWFEATTPFSGNIELPECSEDMIGDISVNVANASVNIKPDFDGEQRVLEYELVLDLNIKVYAEENITIISDVNSVSKQLNPKFANAKINSLLMKNISKCKVTDKIKLDSEKGHVMQLCCSKGKVKIDNISTMENAIMVEGVVDIDMMYISSDDKLPICSQKEIIPFTQEVEVNNVNTDSIVTIRPSLEQISTNMAGNNEIEVKGYVSLDCLVFDGSSEEFIESVEECEFDKDIVQKSPCIVGYRVKSGDTLWKIAKKYYTSVDSLKTLNELRSDEIKEGDMLLVVKETI